MISRSRVNQLLFLSIIILAVVAGWAVSELFKNNTSEVSNDIDLKFTETAKISFFDINNNLIETKKYGIVNLDVIYDKILKQEPIDISRCYIKNFSLSQYRKLNDLPANEKINLLDFTAVDSIFESDKVIDFSLF